MSTVTQTQNAKRKSWQQMVAAEYRVWLAEGGSKKRKALRVAAFDRIADKWASEFSL
jgi:hypothetical protein